MTSETPPLLPTPFTFSSKPLHDVFPKVLVEEKKIPSKKVLKKVNDVTEPVSRKKEQRPSPSFPPPGGKKKE